MNKHNLADLPITHDRLFRKVLGYKYVARQFFKGFLPKALLRRCDMRTLRKSPAAVMGKGHQDHFMDLAYSCSASVAEGRATLLFLLEHKSQDDKGLQRQLLRYMLEIWQHQKDGKMPLERIIPIVVYHGEKALEFSPLYGDFGGKDELFDTYVPVINYHLVDLQALPESEIVRLAHGVLGLVFRAMKHVWKPQSLTEDLNEALRLLGIKSTSDQDRNLLDTLLVYIVDKLKPSPQTFTQIMEKYQEVVKPTEGSLLEYLIEHQESVGVQKGLEKGMEKGLEKAALGMHAIGMPTEQIALILSTTNDWVRTVLASGNSVDTFPTA